MFLLLGSIVAPKTLYGWKGWAKNGFWLGFNSIQGLTIKGPGQINGPGLNVVGKQALHFNDCEGLRLSGTTHVDSPSLHISIVNCRNVDIGFLRILAPADSPNTDGIDLSVSSQINIHDSNIRTGDDCVAINGGIYDINVTRVNCGPGHGISIGSLGENHRHDTVEKVRGGSGYARGIVFQDIHMVNVENPIIIDQHYCRIMQMVFAQHQ
ncbi:putative endo-polygalacturonase [Helianthus annuus]|nr:putative endo-polygalacturonase [Helianthus annuus]